MRDLEAQGSDDMATIPKASSRALRPGSMVCTICKRGSLRRSHRRGSLERALGLLRLYPYRCEECQDRHWHFGRPETPYLRLNLRLDNIAWNWRRRRGELWLYLLGLCAFVIFLYYVTRDRTG